MRRVSLRLRLAAAGAGAILAALALTAVGLGELFESHVERRAMAEMAVHLDQVIAGMERDKDGKLIAGRPLADPRFARPLSGLYWQVSAEGGLVRSRSLWDYALPLPDDELPSGMLHSHDLIGPRGEYLIAMERRVTLPARLGGTAVRAVVAMDSADLDAATQAFMGDLTPYLALLAATLIGAGWVQVTVGLRPLGQVGARVAAVRSGAARRLGDDFPAEVRPLAAEVDTLLAAREAEIERAGARAADLAHGLKTPLQALIGEASRLRADGRIAAADGIEEIALAMRRHVDRELARARIAARAPTAACDPSMVIARVIAVVARTPDGARVTWARDLATGLSARIDPDDLAEALGALIENAARHASGDVAVATSAPGAQSGDIVITVRDDGPGIPESARERLMDRGARMDLSGMGAGLGLSIAREIAAASGGALELRNLGPGLEARLTLRAAPAAAAD